MRYVEILITSGDEYFRQNTLESIPLAIQQYVEASHVKAYAQLDASLNDFSNAAFDMELDFPFFSDPAARGASIGSSYTFSMTGILKTTYFCVPLNPRLTDLRNLIDDRLYKIRNCQDINGTSRSLALWVPSLDPGLLVRAAAKGISPTELLNDTVGPMPNYRFVYLLHKAFEMAAELKSLGAMFLSVREKKGGEALQNLRARQDRDLQGFTAELRELAKQEAGKQIAALEETRKGQVSRLQNYLALASETGKKLRMTSNEKLEMEMAHKATLLNQKASFLDLGQIQLLGVGVMIGSPIKSISEALAIVASVMRQQAQMCADDSFQASRKPA
ncbi:hypothetical protein K458DRAFT_441611 [Lentithecium fluviatile CBS 122367]|uniref:Uncharacterized protein n=1 Tax=Lentithecium fluviatile CBS 122367 TaxID=1168545 RepID=A0A6G1J9N5_9PLEO|nr:hypothetical protein K458DRAFT_441611 [Lentithecium fluviatile CBS 122367]